MAGKHKKPQNRHGIGTGGFPRWERAAANALLKPNSKGGRLYLRRTSLAYQVSEECRNSMDVDPGQAYQHIEIDYTDTRPRQRVGKRAYVTCSVFCTVMVLQLRFAEGTLEAISKAFSENHRVYEGRDPVTGDSRYGDSGIPKVKQLNKGDLKGRTAACRYCGSKVK
jgi:hypothetical protein